MIQVSIGLPFFNNQKTLADAIRSVFAQTLRDWELILVDDGSTDGSLALAQRIRDPRVRLVSDGVNRGLSPRLNQIAALARGRYVARLDGDDMMHPERLERQIAVLEGNPGVDMVGTAMYSLDRSDRPRGIQGLARGNTRPISMLTRALLLHATITGRTEWFRHHPYDECRRRSEDRELFIRTFRNLSFVHLAEGLYFCREELSVRLDKYLESCREARSIFRQYAPEMVGRPCAAALCLASWLKGEIYRLCIRLHAEQYLVRRRNTPLTEEQAGVAAEIIERIRAMPVPGLPSISGHFDAAKKWAFSSRSDLPIDHCAGLTERGPVA
jgi:glycosyltransferase involved in cell wall biosynthesis